MTTPTPNGTAANGAPAANGNGAPPPAAAPAAAAPTTATNTTTTSLLPESVLRAIRGEATAEEKRGAYDQGLRRWWGEYAARKNDEEEEHVADSLMYDERLHLPRTTRRPDVCDE
jgi:hypothetical protein